MSDVIKEYSNDEITVIWQPSKCSHSAVCAQSLGAVFNPKSRPWVNMQGSDSDSIVKTVEQCPSGALSIKGKQTQVQPDTDTVTGVSIKLFENGPMLVKGDVTIKMADQTEQHVSNPALCRCGASANKPFCDGSHTKVDFKG